jgi:hypothetical protein
MQFELTDLEKEHLVAILERQVKKTVWVLENRDVDNREKLEERVKVMKDLIIKMGGNPNGA